MGKIGAQVLNIAQFNICERLMSREVIAFLLFSPGNSLLTVADWHKRNSCPGCHNSVAFTGLALPYFSKFTSFGFTSFISLTRS